jgi:hypothetical protein
MATQTYTEHDMRRIANLSLEWATVAIAGSLLRAKKRPPQETVISTETAHGIIVSSAAEKSASLPPPFNPHYAPVLG